MIQRGSEAKLQSCSDAADVWVHRSTAFPTLWPRSANKENTCVSSLSVRIKRLSTVCALPNVSLTTCLSLSNRNAMSTLQSSQDFILSLFLKQSFISSRLPLSLLCSWLWPWTADPPPPSPKCGITAVYHHGQEIFLCVSRPVVDS